MATRNVVDTSLAGQTGTSSFVGSTSPTLTTPTINGSTLNQTASNTTFTGSTALAQTFVPYQTSYNELSGFDFFEGSPFARIAAYKTSAGSIIKMGTSNSYGSGITNTAVTIDPSGIMTLSSALPVDSGGTGATSATSYAVLCGGTSSTGAFQSVASVGTAGQVLTSNGAGTLPTFQTLQQGNIVAWVNFNGTGTPAINASGNVSSITDNGTGDYTLNYTTTLSSANYALAGFGVATGGATVSLAGNTTTVTLKSTTQTRIVTCGTDSVSYDMVDISAVVIL